MTETKIITLVENNCVIDEHTNADGLLGEHGSSFYIYAGGKRILFDTGNGFTIINNARALNIDLTALDAIVLSHAHQDHTGGLEAVLKLTGEIEVFAHPTIFKPKYTVVRGKEPRRFSLPETREKYESLGAKFILKGEKKSNITENIFTIGPIERVKPSDDAKMPTRHIKENDEFIPDSFSDEQALVVDTPGGLVIILGCTHNGLENTINEIFGALGRKNILGIVGGLHLCDTGTARIEELAAWLNNLHVSHLLIGHCTGFKAASILYQALGETVSFNNVGKLMIF
jgi:7,8-dihydropterin-6-yl-methyl-4-(beta-D-ribofuranosyl)aminobenzene 5'-phosphate synthase